jgi:DNA-binding FrmR family transcriptional regulator
MGDWTSVISPAASVSVLVLPGPAKLVSLNTLWTSYRNCIFTCSVMTNSFTSAQSAVTRDGPVMALRPESVRALGEERECADVLQLVAACRGALNGLMAELIEGHLRFHVLSPNGRNSATQTEAAEELMEVVRTYLK